MHLQETTRQHSSKACVVAVRYEENTRFSASCVVWRSCSRLVQDSSSHPWPEDILSRAQYLSIAQSCIRELAGKGLFSPLEGSKTSGGVFLYVIAHAHDSMGEMGFLHPASRFSARSMGVPRLHKGRCRMESFVLVPLVSK